jgi:monoamine oxidase
MEGIWSNPFDEIVGGTDLLARAFAKHLRLKPRMACEVVKIKWNDNKAAAIYRTGNEVKREEGDFLICTLPFPVLRQVAFEPGLSPGKSQAVRELTYNSSTKVLALVRNRFWETKDRIFGGTTYTDLPTGNTYYPSDNADRPAPERSRGPGVLLASYSWGQPARAMAQKTEVERRQAVLDEIGKIHPEIREPGVLRRTASWAWDEHRWSRGGYVLFKPGEHTTLHPHIVRPEGRVYFAGEHASLAHSWIEGALQSSLRAVRELLVTARR